MPNHETRRRSGIAYLLGIVLTTGIFLGVVYLYIAMRPMAFLESGYPVWKAKQEMLDSCNLGSVAVFGDSQADSAVIPNRLQGLSSNLGFAGGTPLEGYFFVKRGTECSHRPEHVILSFGPGAFTTIRPWLWDNAVRYSLLGWSEVAEIRTTAKEIGDDTYFSVTPLIGVNGALRDLLYLSHFPSVYFNSLVEGRVFQREQRNLAKFAEVQSTRGYPNYGAGGGGAAAPAMIAENFHLAPLQRHYFEKTLAMLDKAKVSVDFLITPISDERLPVGQRRILDEYVSYLHLLETRYQNFRLLQKEVPLWPRGMFGDGVHLNYKGAQAFSDLLSRCIAEPNATRPRSPGMGQCDFTLN